MSTGGESSLVDDSFEADLELKPAALFENARDWVNAVLGEPVVGDGQLLPELPVGCGWFFEGEEGETSGGRSEASVGLPGISRVCPVGSETAAWIRGSLEARDFSDEVCFRVLQEGLGKLPRVKRPGFEKGPGYAVLLGLYSLGGFHGVSTAAVENPEVVEYLNAYLKCQCPGHTWCAIYVSKNTRMPMHRDLRNASQSQILAKARVEDCGLRVSPEPDRCASCPQQGSG